MTAFDHRQEHSGRPAVRPRASQSRAGVDDRQSALGWGVEIDRVEIKDVVLPDRRSGSIRRQAEVERERRARVITAEGELQRPKSWPKQPRSWPSRSRAASATVGDRRRGRRRENSTLVLPLPVELLRLLERATPPASERRDEATGTDAAQLRTVRRRRWNHQIPDDARGLELHTRIADTFQRDR